MVENDPALSPIKRKLSEILRVIHPRMQGIVITQPSLIQALRSDYHHAGEVLFRSRLVGTYRQDECREGYFFRKRRILINLTAKNWNNLDLMGEAFAWTTG